MSFIPIHSSTPKFVSVVHQPAHFVLSQPGRRLSFESSQEKSTTKTTTTRTLRKRRTKQLNISTAINRQHYFRDETRDERKQTSREILFCLPLKFFQRRHHGPCHV